MSTRGQAKNHKREELAGKRVSFFPSLPAQLGVGSSSDGFRRGRVARPSPDQSSRLAGRRQDQNQVHLPGCPKTTGPPCWSSLSPASASCTRSQNTRTSSSILRHDPPWSIPALAPDLLTEHLTCTSQRGRWKSGKESGRVRWVALTLCSQISCLGKAFN